jgi:hypothetical protein
LDVRVEVEFLIEEVEARRAVTESGRIHYSTSF